MTSYHGGKQRTGQKIADVIYELSTEMEEEFGFKIKGYCEPFCGMLGVYRHIPELFKDHKLKYKAGDVSESVIKMWSAAQDGWKPPTTCTEAKFNKLKYDGKTSAEKGFIGHAFSFGGHDFSGFNVKYGRKNDQTYSSNNVVKISKQLSNVKFKDGMYTQYTNLKNFIIYCDPPYSKSVSTYRNENRDILKFDHKLFWNWVRKMSKNNLVFVSEYSAPNDFTEILNQKHTFYNMKTHKDEKLFILI
jgi:DNA adenine methylase